MWIERNVIMLPANEKANEKDKDYKGSIYLWKNKLYWKDDCEYNLLDAELQHLYILSDEEIKEVDWYYSYAAKGVLKNYINNIKTKNPELSHLMNKVIASTDKALNLPQIPDSFIKLFIEEHNKENAIKKVMVEYYSKHIPYDNQGVSWGVGETQKFLKLKDNTISIKQVKDSWTKEEVEKLCEKAFMSGYLTLEHPALTPEELSEIAEEDWLNWKQKNL